MCGIVCAFDLKQKPEDLRPQILEMAKKIRHRGPRAFGNCRSCFRETAFI